MGFGGGSDMVVEVERRGVRIRNARWEDFCITESGQRDL